MGMDVGQYIRDHLNDEQTQAALHVESSSLILAWAWSWKTRTLTYKIAYLVYGLGVFVDEIFAVTFTNKAANEMKSRLIEISTDIVSKMNTSESGLFGVNTTPPAFHRIGTFHGLFLRFLKQEIEYYKSEFPSLDRYKTTFGVYDDGESKSLIKRIIVASKLEWIIEVDPARSWISKLKNQGITPTWFSKMLQDRQDSHILTIYTAYQKELQKANMMDFDDLLLIPYLIFKSNPEVLSKRQRKFQFVLVDEAQDTNWIQFELMKMLTSNHGNITFIGDDFQSIYRWRGAVMENFLKVQDIRPDMKMFKLQTNYRSKSHIVHASNHIIKHNQKQYDKVVTPHRQAQDKIVVMHHGDEIDEAQHVVDLIAKIKEEKNKNRDQFAILYRKNALSSSFEQQCIMQSIPYKVYGGFKFLERKEIKDILAYVKYLYNPNDTISLKRIINTPRRGISDETIKVLEDYAVVHELTLDHVLHDQTSITWLWLGTRAIESCKKFIMTVDFLKPLIDNLTPSALIEQIINTINYKSFLMDTEGKNAQDKIDNLGELVNLGLNYEWI